MKKLLLKSMLLLCALIVGSSNVWADTAGYTPSAALSSTTGSVTGTAGETWSYSITFDNAGYYGYAATYGWQLGAGPKSGKDRGCRAFSISTSGITGTITKIEVEAGSYNGNSKINVTVGGNDFGTQNQSTYSGQGASKSTFTGTASGEIVISATDAVRAFYLKSITVTYSTGEVVSAPTFSPVAGEVTKGSSVTLTQDAADEIRYTINGDDPTKTTGTVYTTPIVINAATTIKAIAIKGDKVSNVATAAYTVTYPVVSTLDFTDDGWGFPADYDTSEKSYTNEGYSITINAPTGHKARKSGDDLLGLIWGKKDATLTLPAFGFNVSKIKVYGISDAGANITFNVFAGDDAVSTEVASSKVDHEFLIAADKQAAGTIYTIKLTNSNNCQISKIEVFGNGCEAGLVGAAGWATYVTEAPVTYIDGDAFAVTSVGSSVELTSVTSVPTGTPVLLKAAGQKTAILLDAEPGVITNKLAVSDGDDGINDYVLAKHSGVVGFYKWTGSALAAGKVYLPASAVAGARDFIGFDETTGIANINSDAKTLFNGDFYNIAGQRVAQPTKGLYIVNGRKVIIK